MEMREMLVQVYGREAVITKCVHERFKYFPEGKETTEDESHSVHFDKQNLKNYRESTTNAGTKSAADAKIHC